MLIAYYNYPQLFKSRFLQFFNIPVEYHLLRTFRRTGKSLKNIIISLYHTDQFLLNSLQILHLCMDYLYHFLSYFHSISESLKYCAKLYRFSRLKNSFSFKNANLLIISLLLDVHYLHLLLFLNSKWLLLPDCLIKFEV
jgi:hypothetical protein